MSRLARWGAAQRAQCQQQFDLFTSSSGAEGWDPDQVDGEYIKTAFKDDDICRPYLHKNLGGHSSNKKDSDKAIQGYQRAASEFYVQQALLGIRRNDHRNQRKTTAGACWHFVCFVRRQRCLTLCPPSSSFNRQVQGRQGCTGSCSNGSQRGWWQCQKGSHDDEEEEEEEGRRLGRHDRRGEEAGDRSCSRRCQ